MMKYEFEALVKEKITDEEWEKVETVYMWYSEKFDKMTIAQLWCLDKKIIYDMYPRAKKIRDIHDKIRDILNKIGEYEKRIRELKNELQILQTQP